MRNSSCFYQGRWVDLGSVVQVSGVEALDGDAFGTAGSGGYTLYEFLTGLWWCCGYYIYPLLSAVVYLRLCFWLRSGSVDTLNALSYILSGGIIDLKLCIISHILVSKSYQNVKRLA